MMLLKIVSVDYHKNICCLFTGHLTFSVAYLFLIYYLLLVYLPSISLLALIGFFFILAHGHGGLNFCQIQHRCIHGNQAGQPLLPIIYCWFTANSSALRKN